MAVIVAKKPSVVFKHENKTCRIVKETIPARDGKDYVQWDIEVKEGDEVIIKDKVVKNWNGMYQLESRSREFKYLSEVATRYTIYEG